MPAMVLSSTLITRRWRLFQETAWSAFKQAWPAFHQAEAWHRKRWSRDAIANFQNMMVCELKAEPAVNLLTQPLLLKAIEDADKDCAAHGKEFLTTKLRNQLTRLLAIKKQTDKTGEEMKKFWKKVIHRVVLGIGPQKPERWFKLARLTFRIRELEPAIEFVPHTA